MKTSGLKYFYSDKIINKNFMNLLYENKFNLVNFHGPKANLMHLYYYKKINIPSVTTIHSDYRYDFLNNKIKYILYTRLNIISLKKFRYFICVSEELKKLLDTQGFIGKKAVIKNGMDFENVNIKNGPDVIREKYNIDAQDFVYIYVARMHPIKNHMNLIMAYRNLISEFSDTKLILIGGGIQEEKLKEYAGEYKLGSNVIFAGQRYDAVDFINASDISLLVSLNEGGIPTLTMLESGAVKKPMICSDIGNFKDIINKDNGFLVDPNSVESIYEKMKEAYIRKNELREMGENLNKCLKINYSLKNFINNYYTFYKDII